MEDHQVQGARGREAKAASSSNVNGSSSERNTEPVRSRWIPKPEQILILESIFNSGMVNPPKEETMRIRKLLEKFGSVGDANVFYWFQNRRSRSRRRQRQLQASLEQRNQEAATAADQVVGGASKYQSSSTSPPPTTAAATMAFGASSAPPSFVSNYGLVGDSSSSSSSASMPLDDHFFSVSGQVGFPENEHTSPGVTSVLGPSDALSLHFQSGINLMMTVFINGVPTEVPRGPLDMKAMFGNTQDVFLVHSSGVPLPINEFGFLAHSLQPGESYFLVSRPT